MRRLCLSLFRMASHAQRRLPLKRGKGICHAFIHIFFSQGIGAWHMFHVKQSAGGHRKKRQPSGDDFIDRGQACWGRKPGSSEGSEKLIPKAFSRIT